jgi:hypothetical protein
MYYKSSPMMQEAYIRNGKHHNIGTIQNTDTEYRIQNAECRMQYTKIPNTYGPLIDTALAFDAGKSIA